MNHHFSWRLRHACACLVAGAGASLCALEGVSFAQERASDPTPSGEPHGPSASIGTVEPGEGRTFSRAREPALALMPVCHISRHPLDGLPPSEHACPLLFADAVWGDDQTVDTQVVDAPAVDAQSMEKTRLIFMRLGWADIFYLRFYYMVRG
jgi:hypothetical protein